MKISLRDPDTNPLYIVTYRTKSQDFQIELTKFMYFTMIFQNNSSDNAEEASNDPN